MCRNGAETSIGRSFENHLITNTVMRIRCAAPGAAHFGAVKNDVVLRGVTRTILLCPFTTLVFVRQDAVANSLQANDAFDQD